MNEENKPKYAMKTKNKIFQEKIAKEFNRIRDKVELSPDDQAVLLVMSSVLWNILDKHRHLSESLKFSDYLKNEPFLDHWFFKLATEYGREKSAKKKPKYQKKVQFKFGIHNVEDR